MDEVGGCGADARKGGKGFLDCGFAMCASHSFDGVGCCWHGVVVLIISCFVVYMIVFALVFRTLAMGMRVFVGPYERIDKEDDQKDGAACFKGVERGVAGTGCYRAVAESKPRGGEKIVDYKSEGYGGYYDGCNIKGGGACAEVFAQEHHRCEVGCGAGPEKHECDTRGEAF